MAGERRPAGGPRGQRPGGPQGQGQGRELGAGRGQARGQGRGNSGNRSGGRGAANGRPRSQSQGGARGGVPSRGQATSGDRARKRREFPSKAAPARRAALRLFAECRRREAHARDFLRSARAMEELDPRDRALATRLVLGAVAARGELDRVIAGHLRAKSQVEPLVQDALRLAAFEILYMDTQAQVAVSQGVELVRSVSERADGLANAVLRKVADEDAKALSDARAKVAAGEFGVSDLQRVGALPAWLAERALVDLGREKAAAYAEAALEPVCASVATSPAKHTVEEARALLVKAGLDPEEGPVAGSFVLGSPALLAGCGLVQRCDVLPCDLAAQEVVAILCATLGEPAAQSVLEVGQGRGTKSVLLAGGLPSATITAVEVDPRKSALAARRMEIAGVGGRVNCVCDDGRTLLRVGESYDAVFVDAPCSGTGTLARHPEIAWNLEEGGISGLAALQLQMLRAASARTAPGGTLAYSTCSVLREEDEDVVEAFLAGPEGEPFTLESTHRSAIQGADRHFLAILRRA